MARAEPSPQPKDEPKPDPKPADGPLAITDKPRMLRSFDVASKGVYEVRWNATGTHLAFSGSQTWPDGPEAQATRMVVWLLALDPKAERQFFYPKLGSTLVAVAPDGHMALTDLREYHLVSGHHQLSPWAGEFDVKKGAVAPQWVELLGTKLDLPETHGYAFSGDFVQMMKTFRTVAYVRDAAGTIKQLEVLEVGTQSGKVTKSLLTAEFDGGPQALSANGKRLVTLDKTGKRLVAYDLDRGASLCSVDLRDPAPELSTGRETMSAGREITSLAVSPDGRRAIVARGVARTQVIDTDTGKELPTLEGGSEARLYPDTLAFSGDGRLMAAAGMRYKVTVSKAPGGKEQKQYSPASGFLGVWDTQTGKAVKTWDRGNQAAVRAAFNPTRPLLAILEQNGDHTIRVGFWDFAADVAKK